MGSVSRIPDIHVNNYLWLVRGHFTAHRCEHATGLAAGNAQVDADVSLEAHAATLQRCVDCYVHGVVALARIVFVDQRAVVGHLVPGRPPAFRIEKISVESVK